MLRVEVDSLYTVTTLLAAGAKGAPSAPPPPASQASQFPAWLADDFDACAPPAEAGRLRVLAVPNARRVSLIPEVPTVAEGGLPGFDGMDWAALMAPRALPAPILAQLNQAVTTVLREPELVQNMTGRRLVLMPTTPAEASAFLQAETARWAPVIRASGARPD